MKTIIGLLLTAFLCINSISQVVAGSIFLGEDAHIPYCEGGECGLDKGVELVKTGVKDVKTDGTFSSYIQDVVVYLLGFITLIAVIYIIYAGFRILISNGDEETIKKSKSTIIYVIVGIVVIWLAWTLANFAVNLGNAGT